MLLTLLLSLLAQASPDVAALEADAPVVTLGLSAPAGGRSELVGLWRPAQRQAWAHRVQQWASGTVGGTEVQVRLSAADTLTLWLSPEQLTHWEQRVLPSLAASFSLLAGQGGVALPNTSPIEAWAEPRPLGVWGVDLWLPPLVWPRALPQPRGGDGWQRTASTTARPAVATANTCPDALYAWLPGARAGDEAAVAHLLEAQERCAPPMPTKSAPLRFHREALGVPATARTDDQLVQVHSELPVTVTVAGQRRALPADTTAGFFHGEPHPTLTVRHETLGAVAGPLPVPSGSWSVRSEHLPGHGLPDVAARSAREARAWGAAAGLVFVLGTAAGVAAWLQGEASRRATLEAESTTDPALRYEAEQYAAAARARSTALWVSGSLAAAGGLTLGLAGALPAQSRAHRARQRLATLREAEPEPLPAALSSVPAH